jgi:Predicted glycosyltransferases
MKKLLIGIPTSEFARAAVFYDWMDLIEKPEGFEIVHTRAHGQSPARGRNLIIQQALESECDYILFVDDDCLLPPPTLKKLLAHDVDCVTGLYCMRNFPHNPIIFSEAYDDGRCRWMKLEDGQKGLIEIAATGMGALLTKIEVFKKINESHKYWVTLGELEADHWCDDLSFFKRVREAGFKIHCDLSCPVGHVAKATIWPNYIENKWNLSYDTEGKGQVTFPLPSVQPLGLSLAGSMRPPSAKRQTTYLNGVMQIHITNICDLSCPNCSQGCNLHTHPQSMTLDQFETAVISVKDYYGVIGVYGGNPTLHHQFPEICEILRHHIPFEQRGLFTNGLSGHGKVCQETFNPTYSNLNIHANMDVYAEFERDWPQAISNVKGFNPSRHSSLWVAIKDVEDLSDEDKWKRILDCDINKYWSALIGLFRGEIRAWFCEIAGSQSRLHEDDPAYPDTGLKVEQGWWKLPIQNFEHQVLKHCWDCGIPLRGKGDLDNGINEYVSKTHLPIYKLKRPNGKVIHEVKLYRDLGALVPRVTDYIENGLLVDTSV